ncbi:hypothetical protein [Streptomyces sp900129855]|uniref:Uncharacterized protein n=1 Tax=Streptomyces sp. 900129855 TaxID=3155129 RepID=A0ABV2ZMS6_9ACTN
MEPSNRTVVTVAHHETVHARELDSGDVFTLPGAPTTPLTITGTIRHTVISAELTLLALPLPGRTEPLHLPATTPVHPHRMVRRYSLRCLLCSKTEDIELDLPRDGRPLSFVCGDHIPDPGPAEDNPGEREPNR